MPEQPTTSSPEQDIAKGLAEFRQGRKSLLPEFELPTDDLPEDEQPEISTERLTVYNLEQILKELNVEERLRDPDFLQELTEYINDSLEHGKTNLIDASLACQTISAIYFLGIRHPEFSPEKLDLKLNDSNFFIQLTEYINESLEQGKIDPSSASDSCETISAIYSLGIRHPELTPGKLGSKFNDPDFLKQLTKDLNDDFEQGKTDPVYASWACRIISAIYSLGIRHSEFSPEKLDLKLNDPNFLKQLTEYINNNLKQGKTGQNPASYACRTLSAIQNIINHYSAIADEKEKAEATHKLQTAADRTGVPPRPEVKSF